MKNKGMTRVIMHLNQRSVSNVERSSVILGMEREDKAKVVSTALEIARKIMEMRAKGCTFLIRKDGVTEKEMIISV